jgi:hypothetical protein
MGEGAPSGDDASTVDAGSGDDSASESANEGGDAGTGPGNPGASVSVTFTYTPQWDGALSVEVVGGFGLSTDWSKTASLVTLTKAGGVFTGTAMLAPGTYLYVFRVKGDALAAAPATYMRYAVDPLDTAFAACPAASPTYSKIDVNPCSQLTVTPAGAGAGAAPVHVNGTVSIGQGPATGWMVWLERDEPKSHHFFANRVTLGSDGTFDLVGSAGSYRLQIQYPTLLSQTDLQRDPSSLMALRRAISDAFKLVATDVAVATPDVGFAQYGLFAPSGDAGTLPTTFSFETGEARLDVYGGAGDGGVIDIGDPWFTSDTTNSGSAAFKGAFNTKQATEDATAPGTRYMWGTEQAFGADASVAWTNQSMVLPVVWQ